MKERALITGGAGFIGSHLATALIDAGFRVRVMDNFDALIHGGETPLWMNKKAEYVRGDVRNKNDWTAVLRRVDYVFHLAGYLDFHLDFSTFFTVNTASTALLYEVIVEKKYPIKKVVVASSQSVYGEGKYRCKTHGIFYPSPRAERELKKHEWEVRCVRGNHDVDPLPEKEDDFLKPIIPYGISKRAVEDIAWDLGKRYEIPSVVMRYTIAHGSHQTFRHFYSGALRQFAVMAMAGEPMTMHEDGMQIRDYVNVKDVAAAHLTVLSDPAADFRAFNVGIGTPLRVTELAKIVAHAAGIRYDPVFPGLYRIGAPRHSIADVGSLKKLGWRSRVSAEESATEYIEWVKNFPEAKKYLARTLKKMRAAKLLRLSK